VQVVKAVVADAATRTHGPVHVGLHLLERVRPTEAQSTLPPVTMSLDGIPMLQSDAVAL